MGYEYRMVPVPRVMSLEYGQDTRVAITKFMEELTNEMMKDGWEFYRVDMFSIAQAPGCLGAILGQKDTIDSYNVVSFRKVKENSASEDSTNDNQDN